MDKYKLKYEYQKNTKKRLFKVLTLLIIAGFIFGLLYIAIISKSNKELIKNTFNTLFLNIHNNSYNYTTSLINNIKSNVLLTLIVWILGISIIGIPCSIIYLFYKSFVLGFTCSSIIYVYGLKGIIPMFIFIFPLVIDLLVILIVVFYAVQFSNRLYLYLFKRKTINMDVIARKYTKLLIIMLLILLISSLFSSFLVPKLIKSFTKSLF